MCWAWEERGQLRQEGEGLLVGLGCCLKGQRVLSEGAAVAVAAVGLVAEVVAAVVEVDADVAAPRC